MYLARYNMDVVYAPSRMSWWFGGRDFAEPLLLQWKFTFGSTFVRGLEEVFALRVPKISRHFCTPRQSSSCSVKN